MLAAVLAGVCALAAAQSATPTASSFAGAGRSATATGTPSLAPSISSAASPTTTFIPNMVTLIVGKNFVSGTQGVGGPGTSALLSGPSGVATDASGNVYISDSCAIRKWTASTGFITTVAGIVGICSSPSVAVGASATSTPFVSPWGVAVDNAGNLYVSDSGCHNVRKVDAATGNIQTIAGSTGCTWGNTGNGGPGTSARLNGPAGIALDNTGSNLYIADANNFVIYRWTASTGIISVVAGSYTVGDSGDGGPGTSAKIGQVCGIATDAAGNVFMAQSKNDASGQSGFGFHRVRRWSSSTGIITTIIGTGNRGYSGDGGPGTSALLSNPIGVAVDALGSVYVAEFNGPFGTVGNNWGIRFWNSQLDVVSTFSGAGSSVTGIGGLASAMGSLRPGGGLALDRSGANLFFSDWFSVSRVALAAPPTSTATPSPSLSRTPYCWPSLYRALARTDLVGTLVGSALFPGSGFLAASETACRQACCDAATCSAYAFASPNLLLSPSLGAQCFLLVNVTALVPSNMMSSGVLLSVYS